jgi:hypothetical protein
LIGAGSMSIVAFAVVYIALAGAVASWIAGAYFYARTLKVLGVAPRKIWYAVAFSRADGCRAARRKMPPRSTRPWWRSSLVCWWHSRQPPPPPIFSVSPSSHRHVVAIKSSAK